MVLNGTTLETKSILNGITQFYLMAQHLRQSQ